MAYTDLASAKVYLGISTGTTGDDTLITNLLTRSQKQIEQYCKRVFETTSSSAIRYYRQDDIITLPSGSQYRAAGSQYIGAGQYSWDAWPTSNFGSGMYGHTVLWLGTDCRSVGAITNGDGTTITSTEYWLEPRNEAPYQYVRLKSGKSWVFDTDGEVSITGDYCFTTAAPADIVQATERLVAYHYRRRDQSEYDVTASAELGQIIAPPGMPSDVKKILDEGGYVRRIRVV